MREIRKLKEAVQSEDETRFREAYPVVQSELFLFVKRNYRVSREDAEDAVQQAIVAFVQSVRKGNVVSDERLGAYIGTICKRELARLVMRDMVLRDSAEMDVEYGVVPANTMERREMMGILSDCLNALDPERRAFILDWMADPDAKRMAAERGGSLNAIYTRKSRILRLLARCAEKAAR